MEVTGLKLDSTIHIYNWWIHLVLRSKHVEIIIYQPMPQEPASVLTRFPNNPQTSFAFTFLISEQLIQLCPHPWTFQNVDSKVRDSCLKELVSPDTLSAMPSPWYYLNISSPHKTSIHIKIISMALVTTICRYVTIYSNNIKVTFIKLFFLLLGTGSDVPGYPSRLSSTFSTIYSRSPSTALSHPCAPPSGSPAPPCWWSRWWSSAPWGSLSMSGPQVSWSFLHRALFLLCSVSR